MSSLSVSASGAAADAIGRHVPTLVDDAVASRLFAQDATLWGPDAESESRIRLSWVGLPRSSRPLVGEIAALRDSLAACRAAGVGVAPPHRSSPPLSACSATSIWATLGPPRPRAPARPSRSRCSGLRLARRTASCLSRLVISVRTSDCRSRCLSWR